MFDFIYLHKSFTALSLWVHFLKQGVETEMANVR